jgi:hypothetical protein
MIGHLLDGDAIRGAVASLTEVKVVVKVKAVRRAVMALDSPDTVILPEGKQLWWTETAGDYPWNVQSVRPIDTGSRIVLRLTGKPTAERLPVVGQLITLSTLCTAPAHFGLPPPVEAPWTHRPDVPPSAPEPIDTGDSEQPAAPVDAAAAEDPGRYT